MYIVYNEKLVQISTDSLDQTDMIRNVDVWTSCDANADLYWRHTTTGWVCTRSHPGLAPVLTGTLQRGTTIVRRHIDTGRQDTHVTCMTLASVTLRMDG